MFPVIDQPGAVRRFNRFYTKQLGLLGEDYLGSPFSLTQARVLYELGQLPRTRWTDLGAELELDAGYLSRLLKGFVKAGLVRRAVSTEDRRVNHLSLTVRGRKAFESLNAQSAAKIGALLEKLDPGQRQQLVDAMEIIGRLLTPVTPSPSAAKAEEGVLLRSPKPGEIGWIIARHGELYAGEYQWDATFEGLVAKIASEFLMNFDAERERCWIAEHAGQRVGCIFLVKQSRTVGKLRLLLVEPGARGLGLGTKLVDECVAFARQAGYRKLTLWTNDVLYAARRVYQKAGFCLVKEERHRSFGHDLMGQYWELKLRNR